MSNDTLFRIKNQELRIGLLSYPDNPFSSVYSVDYTHASSLYYARSSDEGEAATSGIVESSTEMEDTNVYNENRSNELQEYASTTPYKDEFAGIQRRSKERDDDKWEFSDRQAHDYRMDYQPIKQEPKDQKDQPREWFPLIPSEVEVGKSSSGSALVRARKEIPRGTRFGPFLGKWASEPHNPRYAWEHIMQEIMPKVSQENEETRFLFISAPLTHYSSVLHHQVDRF
ncbi:hypothetical protein KQX54_009880 [Cotesia glomerata]|uniref:Uncharacterized protein n=1 Tax=Cotesia glomerata TaxID=32391 RepID=A0AAV7J0P5_COTGL|nr:hypothetical protein KQX54_009880 [Cotesia glomerata]